MKKEYKYNPDWENHRQWLAERLIKVVIGYGYMLNFDNEFPEQIFIKKFPNGRAVKIFTSIDGRTSQVRTVGIDAVRVVVIEPDTPGDYQGLSNCFYIRRINRAGTINSIATRLVRAIKEAEKKARFHKPKKKT